MAKIRGSLAMPRTSDSEMDDLTQRFRRARLDQPSGRRGARQRGPTSPETANGADAAAQRIVKNERESLSFTSIEKKLQNKDHLAGYKKRDKITAAQKEEEYVNKFSITVE